MYTVPPIFTYAPLGRAPRQDLGKPQAWAPQVSGALPRPGYVPWSAARPAGATRLPRQLRLGCLRGRSFRGAAGAGSLGACRAASPGCLARRRGRVPGRAPRAAGGCLPARGGAGAAGRGSRDALGPAPLGRPLATNSRGLHPAGLQRGHSGSTEETAGFPGLCCLQACPLQRWTRTGGIRSAYNSRSALWGK